MYFLVCSLDLWTEELIDQEGYDKSSYFYVFPTKKASAQKEAWNVYLH